MQVLADNGGYVLAEVGHRLLFIERRIVPTWAVFVPGLVAGISAANAVLQAVLGNLAASAALLAVAAASGAGCLAAGRSRRRSRATPLAAEDALLQLDLESRRLLDGSGQVLSGLAEARIARSMQLTSSARALTISWPGGERIVYRGDALAPGGSIDAATEALRARGVATT